MSGFKNFVDVIFIKDIIIESNMKIKKIVMLVLDSFCTNFITYLPPISAAIAR